jgi:2-dehydro-3-deoxygluconokinase
MSEGLDVVTIGELLGVISPFDLHAPLESSVLLERSVGGSEVNVALALARLGNRVGWAGAVGDDPFGRAGVRLLRGEGVDVSRVVVSSSAPTGVYFKEVLPLSGLRNYPYRDTSAARELEGTDADVAYLLSGRVLHLTGITAMISSSGETLVRRLLTEARASDVHLSFDANIRQTLMRGRDPATLLRPLASAADTLFLSTSESLLLFATDDPQRLRSLLPTMRVTTIVLHDARGAQAITKETIDVGEARSVVTIDATGAGDAFVAGYLHQLLAGASMDARLACAEECAAYTVASRGDHAMTFAPPPPSAASGDAVDLR